jgi:hypothetical protein
MSLLFALTNGPRAASNRRDTFSAMAAFWTEAAARIRKVNDPVGAEHAVSLAQAALGQHGEGSVDVHDGER